MVYNIYRAIHRLGVLFTTMNPLFTIMVLLFTAMVNVIALSI